MLEHLGKGKIFTSLDLRSAYTNAFTFKLGYFEYTVMLFGLKNTPAVCEYNVLRLKFSCFFFFFFFNDELRKNGFFFLYSNYNKLLTNKIRIYKYVFSEKAYFSLRCFIVPNIYNL